MVKIFLPLAFNTNLAIFKIVNNTLDWIFCQTLGKDAQNGTVRLLSGAE